MKSSPIPDAILVLMAEKFRMLSDSTRLTILRCLMNREELNVSELVHETGKELANVSKHLKQMADVGLVARRKEGSFVLYRLNDPILKRICELVCNSLQRDLKLELKRKEKLLKKGKNR